MDEDVEKTHPKSIHINKGKFLYTGWNSGKLYSCSTNCVHHFFWEMFPSIQLSYRTSYKFPHRADERLIQHSPRYTTHTERPSAAITSQHNTGHGPRYTTHAEYSTQHYAAHSTVQNMNEWINSHFGPWAVNPLKIHIRYTQNAHHQQQNTGCERVL